MYNRIQHDTTFCSRNKNRSHRHPGGYEVALVEDEDEVLVRLVFAEEPLDVRRAGTDRVTGVQHLDDHVRRVDHLPTGVSTVRMSITCQQVSARQRSS